MTVLMYLVCFFGMIISAIVCAIRVITGGIAQSFKEDRNTPWRKHKQNKIFINMLVTFIFFVLCAFFAIIGA